jgi:serine/threonine-protein kinase ATR
MKKRDDKEVRTQLKQARIDIMAPLSAASLESYERAYPFVTRLHMLTELEHRYICSRRAD